MASICRLCLKSSTEEHYCSITSVNQEALITILPDIDIHIVQSPVICTDCENSLNQAYSFKSTCLATEKRIMTFAETYGSNINLYDVLCNQELRESKPDVEHTVSQDTFSLTTSIEIKEETPEFDDLVNHGDDIRDVIEPVVLCTDNIKLCCEICFKTFKTEEELSFHKKTHLNKYQCGSCGKSFALAWLLKKHIRRFHPVFKKNIVTEIKRTNYDIPVENCDKCKNEAYECTEHQQSKLRYKCKICGKLFQYIYLLRRHQILHPKENSHMCKICKKSFVRASYLQRHITVRHGGKYEKICCPTCGKLLLDEICLERHIHTFHSELNSSNSKVCEVCYKKFYRLSSYRRHMHIHKEEPKFICTICKKSFGTKYCLQKHINTDHFDQRDLIKYICEFCELEFVRRREYVNHKKENHPAEGNIYTCEICGISCNIKANLDVHMRIHTGERPYKCDECGKSFSQVGSMNVHKRSKHSNVKPYSCQYCNKSFALKSVWAKHVERVHEVGVSEKKFSCSYCSRAFHVQSELTRHMKWHIGERKFICDICNKGFINNASLKRHKLTHDKKNAYL